MNAGSTQAHSDSPNANPTASARARRIALVGNPNTGKTTLFNRLTGLRHKTSNFPGTTLEARIGRMNSASADVDIIDLPGIYSLELDQLEAAVARDALAGRTAPSGDQAREPDALCVVVDATNLARNLMLVGEALRRRLPTVIAVNMIDLSRKQGLHLDLAQLESGLGCRAVAICARSGEGLDTLRDALANAAIPTRTPPGTDQGLAHWADDLAIRGTSALHPSDATHDVGDAFTERLDRILTHPFAGGLVFALAMAALFWLLFTIAAYPMDLIDGLFSHLTAWIKSTLPPGILREFLSGGVVSGLGATLIFLPQIALLFFVISILEDTGYLARAAFLMDRLLRPFGLPGHAFVPLLSSHACALPGIMACRSIPDRRQRLATILVAPFMTCSARLPVYVLITGLLFPDSPVRQALAFVACYLLGIAAGLISALVARRTILRGRSLPMALELPSYKRPSLRTALITTLDRALVFIKQAGTNILAISILLWWLSAYPHSAPPPEAQSLSNLAAEVQAAPAGSGLSWEVLNTVRGLEIERTGNPVTPLDEALTEDRRHSITQALQSAADERTAAHAARESFAGQLGRAIQPALAPLGYDWQLSIGVLASFAAREVFVSTLAVVATGHQDADDQGVQQRLMQAKRDDARTPIFTRPTCWSLLVYYVLAMQCLPTLAVTRREAGGLKWALLQFAWMIALAYVGAWIAFRVAS